MRQASGDRRSPGVAQHVAGGLADLARAKPGNEPRDRHSGQRTLGSMSDPHRTPTREAAPTREAHSTTPMPSARSVIGSTITSLGWENQRGHSRRAARAAAGPHARCPRIPAYPVCQQVKRGRRSRRPATDLEEHLNSTTILTVVREHFLRTRTNARYFAIFGKWSRNVR